MKDTRKIAELARSNSEFIIGCAETISSHVASEVAKQARADALRWVLMKLNYVREDTAEGDTAFREACSELQAIIEKELNRESSDIR